MEDKTTVYGMPSLVKFENMEALPKIRGAPIMPALK